MKYQFINFWKIVLSFKLSTILYDIMIDNDNENFCEVCGKIA